MTGSQAEYWNTAGAARWVQQRTVYDALFHEHGEAMLDAAGLHAGSKVLDVGCGCGTTTLTIASRVGSGGTAVGVDISGPMVDVARKRTAAAGFSNVRFEHGDLQTCPLDEDTYDAVVSRLGIMFFDDPVAAFARLRRALRAGGRLSAVCWRDPSENPWIELPRRVTSSFLSTEPIDPNVPGPFSLAKRERVTYVASAAGFSDVAVAPLDLPLFIGRSAQEAATLMVDLGPVGRAIIGVSPDVRFRAVDAVAAALAPYATPQGVKLPSAAWLLTARVR
ncbi:MAG TPA: class I SAM-dependent methyltransferase [Polyangiaceae bacterium]|nr:class I SAM-dependent methyltransferase [Polyangiaceae bacterium]